MTKQRSERAPAVLVATSIGPGKEYALPALLAVLARFKRGGADLYCAVDAGATVTAEARVQLASLSCKVEDVTEAHGGIFARCARVREMARQEFLRGAYSHLYFHDCDMVPDKGVIGALLKLNAPMASALYCLRDLSEPVIPAMCKGAGPAAAMIADLPIETEAPAFSVQAFGMGAMLIRRDVAEDTAFRPARYWDEPERCGEDYQFCIDAGVQPLVSLESIAWHCSDTGQASRPVIGKVNQGVFWCDMGGAVRNHLGYWARGVPKFGVSDEDFAMLHPGSFQRLPCREVGMEKRATADLIK